jgi:hypothetical protein
MDEQTAVISAMLSIAPVLVEPRVATEPEKQVSSSVLRQWQTSRRTKNERNLALCFELIQGSLESIASQRPIVLLLRVDRLEGKTKNQCRLCSQTVRLSRCDDDKIFHRRVREQTKDPFTSGNADGEAGL